MKALIAIVCIVIIISFVKSPHLLADLSIHSNSTVFIRLASKFNKDIDQESLIHFIVYRKKLAHLNNKELELIKTLIKQDFDINAQDIYRNRNSALMTSAGKIDLKSVTLFLNLGAMPNLENNDGNTAATIVCLTLPIQKEGEQILEFLYKNGANLEHVNKEGFSCLTYASQLVKKLRAVEN